MFSILLKMDDSDDYVLWVGNLHRDASEEILFELFLQAGPLTRVKKPNEKNFAFDAVFYRRDQTSVQDLAP